MDSDLLLALYEEIDEIKQMEAYQNLIKLNERINIELKDLIKEFNDAKAKYEEASKYGKFFPDYNLITNNLSQIQIKLENEELVKEYRKNEKIVNDYLEQFKKELVKASRGE